MLGWLKMPVLVACLLLSAGLVGANDAFKRMGDAETPTLSPFTLSNGGHLPLVGLGVGNLGKTLPVDRSLSK